MEGYETKDRIRPEEVTIGKSNLFRVTEDELEDTHGPHEDPGRPLTVEEILFGDGSGVQVRGIMTAMSESRSSEMKLPLLVHRKNRAARRAARKKARGR